jgi:hypothetical protein
MDRSEQAKQATLEAYRYILESRNKRLARERKEQDSKQQEEPGKEES